MSAAPSPSSPPTQAGRRLRWVTWLMVALLGVGFTVIVILLAGQVTGYEFSPQSFTRREFFYFRLPATNIQVSPTLRPKTAAGAESQLRALGVLPPNQTPNRWDVVEMTVEGPRGDASILCGYLEAVDHEGKSVWVEWSRQHPKAAQALWHAVATLAQDGLYTSLPDLFELAEAAENPAGSQLPESLVQKVQQIYRDHVGWYRQAGQPSMARRCQRRSEQYQGPLGDPASSQ